MDGTGISYTSVENYILTQKANGLLKEEQWQSLLENYPYMAYGAIVEAKDEEALYQEAQDKWLPSVLPVFTPSDIQQMLQTQATPFHSVAAYAKKYFLNPQAYLDELNQALRSHNDHKTLLHNQKETLEQDADLLRQFAFYNASWEANTHDSLTKAEQQMQEDKMRIEDLQNELQNIKNEMNTLRLETASSEAKLNDIKYRLNSFQKLIDQLKVEISLEQQYETNNKNLNELTKQYEQKKAEEEQSNLALRDIADKLSEMDNIDKQLRNALESVKDAKEAQIIEDNWLTLLQQYRTLLDAQNKEIRQLRTDMERLIKEKEDKQKEIDKRGCKAEEYEGIQYSEALENKARSEQTIAQQILQEKTQTFDEINRLQGKAESAYETAKKALSKYQGQPLLKHEVGSAFDMRIAENKEAIQNIEVQSKTIANQLTKLQRTKDNASNILEQYHHPTKTLTIELANDYEKQYQNLKANIQSANNAFASGRINVVNRLKEMESQFAFSSQDVRMAIKGMQDLLTNDTLQGDKYYTLCEHIDANIHTVNLRISQIATDLSEFNKTKGDLIHQCMIQGKHMYEGLTKFSNSSKVPIQNKRRQMIKFDIPETVNEEAARVLISAEIEKGAEEIAAKLLDDSCDESAISKIAARTVGSKRLLRKYINLEKIVLKAYKIDRNPDYSGYRTWEQTQVNNSGAEKFVIYFALILALMAYVRDGQYETDPKKNRSVLILDNPFGPISSKHVLEPMFMISKNYNVQMICLSDISKSEILSCFDLVIRAVVKQFAFGSQEQLTHEGNERIEHGFYRSEQLNLWQ